MTKPTRLHISSPIRHGFVPSKLLLLQDAKLPPPYYYKRKLPAQMYTHQEVFLRTATTSGNDREAKAMVAVQIKSLSKCDSNPPLPTVSKRTTAMHTSCDYQGTSLLLLPLHQNPPIYPQNTLKWLQIFVTKTLAKVSKTLSTRSPRQPSPLPPVQYHNHDTPENGNKTLPSAQEDGKTHTAGLQTLRISPRFRYTPLLNNLDHDLALGNAETEDWSGGKQSFRGGETMGLEQMSLPRHPPVAAPPALRSRPPTLGFFLPDHRSPSIRWSRMTVYPSNFPFTHRT